MRMEEEEEECKDNRRINEGEERKERTMGFSKGRVDIGRDYNDDQKGREGNREENLIAMKRTINFWLE